MHSHERLLDNINEVIPMPLNARLILTLEWLWGLITLIKEAIYVELLRWVTVCVIGGYTDLVLS